MALAGSPSERGSTMVRLGAPHPVPQLTGTRGN